MVFWKYHFSKSRKYVDCQNIFLVDKFLSVVVLALVMLIHFHLDHGVFSKHFGTQKFAFRPKLLIFLLSFFF